MLKKEDFLLKSFNLGIIKFGSFILKSGIESPFYVDLRPLASSPELLKDLANFLLELENESNYDLICGVPYAALPMATVMSISSGIPLIIKRKENKGYGTKRMLEGVFSQGQNCLLVEDVITSGKSLIETIQEVEKEGLKVKDLVVVLDRQQGGIEKLKEKGYNVKTLFTINQVIDILFKYNKLDKNQVEKIKDFLNEDSNNNNKIAKIKRLSYQAKLALNKHEMAQKLLNIAIQKKSNLICSADVNSTKELLELAENIGNHIVALKTHIDIINDFSYEQTIEKLKKISKEKNFLLFEDRKFADIGSTQENQFKNGIYKIESWADLVTSHVIAGQKSLEIFGKTGIVAIVEMSSKGTLTDSNYFEQAINIAEKSENVFSAVAQSKIPDNLILMTPGVNLSSQGDSKGQQYNTPEKVFTEYNTDFIIVGRGIYKDENPALKAEEYKKIGWESYIKSL